MKIATFISAFCLSLTIALPVNAAKSDSNKTSKQQMKETKTMRKQMAQVHEDMAKCLRSDKNMDECRQEMRENCEKGDACMMMQMGGMHGKGHMKKSE